MAHQRETIRAAVKAKLIAAATAAAGRVYIAANLPQRESELPVILVWTPSDKTQEDSVQTGPRELDSDLMLEVTALVGDGGDDDEATVNTLDDLCRQIEIAMNDDPFFPVATVNSCANSWLAGTGLDLAKEGEQLMGRGVMTYNFVYTTLAPDAPTGLDDFDTGHSEFVVSDDTNDAEDLFSV